MCIVKTPKIQTTPQEKKEPIIIRSPLLDGVDPKIKALRTGRDAVRIERGMPATSVPAFGVAPSMFAGIPLTPTRPTTTPGAIAGGSRQVSAGRVDRLR